MFQKRHYEEIAERIQNLQSRGIPVAEMIHEFTRMFKDDNPRFDVMRFLRACVPGADVSARPKKVKVPRIKPRKPATDYLNAVTK